MKGILPAADMGAGELRTRGRRLTAGLLGGSELGGMSVPPGERRRDPLPASRVHLAALAGALAALEEDIARIEAWGSYLASVLVGGGRLLAIGNGGSAALAQHLACELVGRYRDDRPAFGAVALCAEGTSLTAIVNDYGPEEAFARQVRAHGRSGDVLVALSTSGRSTNILAAVAAARERVITTWALTGRRPNPLADLCHDAVCADTSATATAQEIHQVVVHLLCAAVDREVVTSPGLPSIEELPDKEPPS